MKKDASPERHTSWATHDSGSSSGSSSGSQDGVRRQRKAYVKPTVTMYGLMVNVTLFSAGATPESTSPPFIPTS